ncbi:hypothetical protein D9M70_557410 [compost metagenome]
MLGQLDGVVLIATKIEQHSNISLLHVQRRIEVMHPITAENFDVAANLAKMGIQILRERLTETPAPEINPSALIGEQVNCRAQVSHFFD